ncbi:uncharacterized protein TNCV_387141 [Trichonephila clavipes]|nr:uncharacterized protein TNCV_387141 [Trichonephila clavipes]
MVPHTITPAVGTECRYKAKEISSFLLRGTTPNGGVDGRASRAAHLMGLAIPNVLQPGFFVWFEKTQRSLVKLLPMPGQRLMKLFSVRVHFLRCGCPLGLSTAS